MTVLEINVAGVIVALALVAFVGLLTALKNWNSWHYEPNLKPGQKLPPGDMGWPLMGNTAKWIKDLQSGNPDKFIFSMTERWGRTGLYKALMFSMPTVIATTPETIKFVLTHDEFFYPGWPKSTNDLMGRKSFTSIGFEDHKRLRALTIRTINGYDVLNSYIPRIEAAALFTLKEWASKDQIYLLDELKKFTFNIIIDIVMSYKPGNRETDLIGAQFGAFNTGIRAMAIKFPGFSYYNAVKAREVICSEIQKGIDKKRQSETRENDVLQAMLDCKDENGKKLDDEELVDLTLMYLNAGHESSAHTMMWINIFMNANPDVYASCKKEQEMIRDTKKPGEGLNLSDFRRMKYLHNVIDETLRMSSVSVQVFRKCIKETEYKGFLFPKGWTAQAYLRHPHQDEQIWPEPHKFNPDRWINLTPKPGAFVPFGMGTRLCPGNDLAKLEIAIFVHHMTLTYRMERINPGAKIVRLPHPQPVDNCPVSIHQL